MYRVTVIESYDPQSRFVFDPLLVAGGRAFCGKDLEFPPGTSFAMRPVRERVNVDCVTHEGVPEGIPNVTIGTTETPAAAGDSFTVMVSARYRVTMGDGCAGRGWNLRIDTLGGRDPFAESTPGERPAVRMTREVGLPEWFSSACARLGVTKDASMSVCRESYVVKLDRVP
jgi:hypothetical protein